MKFTEKVNIEIAKKLKGISYTQFKELWNLSSVNILGLEDQSIEEDDIVKQYGLLTDYCKKLVVDNNQHIVEYKYVDGKDFGRMYSKGYSLQRIYNGFRGVLCQGITNDIDMCNAHPSILVKLCDKHDIECGELKKYVKNRDEYLNELMEIQNISKPEAKKQYIRALNKEFLTLKINNKKITSKKFIKFNTESVAIVNSLYEIYKDEFGKYVNSATFNKKGKLVNLVLTKIENEHLQRAMKYVKTKDIEISTPMFDGFMVYVGDYDIEAIINELNFIFKEDGIKWSQKEHNTELLEHIEGLIINDEVDVCVCDNVIELTDHILNGILKDKLVKCVEGDKLEHFLMTSNRIISGTEGIEAELYSLISKQDYNYYINHLATADNKTEEVKASKVHSHIKQIVESLMNVCPTNNKFIDDVWDYTLNKLFFNNGYYDYLEHKFVYGKFNKTFIKIERDYKEEVEAQYGEEVFIKIFYPMFSIDYLEAEKPEEERSEKCNLRLKLMWRFLYDLGRMMAGNIEDKRWMIVMGPRNCGKSVITDFTKEAFGNYVRSTNSGNFILKKTNGDQAKALSFLVDYRFARMVYTHEMPLEKDQVADGNMFKKFVSGGDIIEARKNFKDEVQLKLQCGLLLCLNDMIPIHPTDALETCDEIYLATKYIDENFDESKKLLNEMYFKKDPTIKSVFLKRPEIIDALTLIIIKSQSQFYPYPEKLKMENKMDKDDDDDVKLFDLFEFTSNMEETLTNEAIEKAIKSKKITISMLKAKKMLKGKGAMDYRDSKKRGLCCIRLAVIENECDMEETL
jgi:hypothetical protein